MYALFDEQDFILIAAVEGDADAATLGRFLSRHRKRSVVATRNCADGCARICARFVDGEQYAAPDGGVTFREPRDR